MNVLVREEGGSGLICDTAGLAATTKEVLGEDGTKKWVSPVVKAKGSLLYSKGRMGRDFGNKEWTQFDDALTSDEKQGLAY